MVSGTKVYFYPVRVCAAGLCVWLRRFVYACMYVYVCVYVAKKIDLFSVLPFEKFLLSILYYLILEFTRLQIGFYVQRVVQTEQFVCVLFKTGSGILHYGMPSLTLCNCNITSSSARSASRQHVYSSAVIDRQRVQCSYHCTYSSPLTVHSVCTGYVFCGTLVYNVII